MSGFHVGVVAMGGGLRVAAGDIYDVARIGEFFWTTEGNSGVTVSKRNADGDILFSFEASAVIGSGQQRVRGITTDGTDLYLVGALDRVVRYTQAGAFVSQSPDLNSWDTGLTGVAHDGTYLRVIGGNTDRMRAYTAAWALASSADLPTAGTWEGAAWFDSHLWIINGARFYKVTTSGSIVLSHPTIGALPDPTGIWIDPDGSVWLTQDGVGLGYWGAL